MKKLFIYAISIFLLAVVAWTIKYFCFGSEESIWASITYYFVLFSLIELFRCWFKYRNRKNREKLNMTESEEEKAVLDSLNNQIKPFKADEADSQNVKI